MDIGVVKNPVDFGGSAQMAQKTPNIQAVDGEKTPKTDGVADKLVTATTDEKVKKPVNLKDLAQMTEAMNRFVQAMDATIRFKIHEKSNQLMVQVVEQTNNVVIKEFPSSEFLDTIAAIRDYVGILLDKKI